MNALNSSFALIIAFTLAACNGSTVGTDVSVGGPDTPAADISAFDFSAPDITRGDVAMEL